MVTPLVTGVVVLLRDGISVEHIGCKCECGMSWDTVIATALSPSGTCCSSVVWISLERYQICCTMTYFDLNRTDQPRAIFKACCDLC
ncbi:hypothetical protein NL676_010603 [Syzygium grande]|nr:hypothetical protein NL676_010603 [Syzygium grande]